MNQSGVARGKPPGLLWEHTAIPGRARGSNHYETEIARDAERNCPLWLTAVAEEPATLRVASCCARVDDVFVQMVRTIWPVFSAGADGERSRREPASLPGRGDQRRVAAPRVVRALLSALRFRHSHPAFAGTFSHHIAGTRTSRPVPGRSPRPVRTAPRWSWTRRPGRPDPGGRSPVGPWIRADEEASLARAPALSPRRKSASTNCGLLQQIVVALRPIRRE